MLNNWVNNPPKREHAVEDICNSATVFSGDACYANPGKISYYHSAFVCRSLLLPLARLWLPVCVGGPTLLSWPGLNVFTQSASCIALLIHFLPRLSFLHPFSSSILSFFFSDPAATWRVSRDGDFYSRPSFAPSV